MDQVRQCGLRCLTRKVRSQQIHDPARNHKELKHCFLYLLLLTVLTVYCVYIDVNPPKIYRYVWLMFFGFWQQ